MAFEDDIKSQNTQLYPVVVIDGAYYSTNNVTIDGNYCKPILMNIPSIKESIDIESRKFKISNVTLDFNNFPFEGVRFSDQLSDTSLINKEAIIYYKSPSTNTIDQMYELFRGIIRRISHDDTKATVELEDLTEKELHRDLPSEILPDTEGILEKYRNKPKPMVYGSVDKSPVVLGSNNKIIIDYKDIDGLDDTKTDFAGDSISPFKIELDGKYMGVLPNVDTDLGTLELNDDEEIQEGLQQWESVENEIEIITNPLTVRGVLQCKGAFKPRTIELESINQNQQNFTDDEVAELTDGIYTNQSLVDIDSTREISTEGNSDNKLIMFRLKIFTDISVSDAIKGSDNFGSRVRKIALNGYFLPIPKQEINHYQLIKIFPVGILSLPDAFKEFSFHSVFSELSGDGYDLTGLFRFGTADYSIYDSNYVIPEDYDIDIQPLVSLSGDITEATYMPTIYMYDICGAGNEGNNGTYLIDFRIHGDWGGDAGDNIDAIYNLGLEGYFKEIDFNAIADIDKVFTKQFYVDVKGRVNKLLDHPVADLFPDFETANIGGVELPIPTTIVYKLVENPIDIIYDLVRTELGHDAIDEADYLEARAEHSDWKFAFTLNKKMNSKKLIEDIAKSTKCFPKFKNDGKFGFNTIKEAYSVEDYENAKEIIYSDIISYTYKKTKPEQIYRKVDVQYNMDYAQDSLLSRTRSLDSGSSEFYGIESSDDAYLEFESPYIRDAHTADRLNFFLTQQYKDDHLILNIKLPLQYIDLEIGKLVKLRELDVKPYGADIRVLETINDSIRYPLFMITSIAKNLDSIQIECMQLHYISIYYSGTFDTNWILEANLNGLFYFPDADPLTITPFIPLSEGEVLGENLWTNQSLDSLVDGDNIVFDGNIYNIFGSSNDLASTNILEVGKLYRWEFEIVESNTTNPNHGIRIYPEQHAPAGGLAPEAYINEVGKYSFDLIKQSYYTSHNPPQEVIILRMFAYYFDGKIKNNISVREVIQEASPFDGGFSPDINSENWTTQTQWTISNNIATYDATVNSKNMSATLLDGHTVNVGEIYEITFTISNVQSGKKAVIAFWNEQTANPFTVGATAYDNGTHTVTGQVRTATSVNQSNKITLVGYTSLNGGSFSISNLSYRKIEASATTFKFRFSDVLQQQEFYKIDNKLNLKDLKDME